MIESLKEFVKPHKSQKFGFSVEDAGGVNWSPDLEESVLSALQGEDRGELSLALILIEGGVINGSLDGNSLRKVIEVVWATIGDSHPRVASSLLRTVRNVCPSFVSKHLEELSDFLRSKHPLVRLEAVRLIGEGRISSLFPMLDCLRDDPYAAEVNMNGRLEFVIRNEAFELLNQHFGSCKKKELFEATDGGTSAYFWDWKPLLKKLP